MIKSVVFMVIVTVFAVLIMRGVNQVESGASKWDNDLREFVEVE